jgi:hypothetical protein
LTRVRHAHRKGEASAPISRSWRDRHSAMLLHAARSSSVAATFLEMRSLVGSHDAHLLHRSLQILLRDAKGLCPVSQLVGLVHVHASSVRSRACLDRRSCAIRWTRPIRAQERTLCSDVATLIRRGRRPYSSGRRFVTFPRSRAGSSRTTSLGSLSLRSPWKTGWRSVPARVNSVNVISAIKRGSTQRTSRASAPRGAPVICGRDTAIGDSVAERNCLPLKPVPTLPAYLKTSPS